MNNNVECAEFLKSHDEYTGCMKELYKKWKSYGKATGNVTLHNVTEDERRALSGIVGKSLEGSDIKFTFKQFEEGLQRTRFGMIDIKEVLEAYFGEKMITNQEVNELGQKRKAHFFDSAVDRIMQNCQEDSQAVSWIKNVAESKKYGYQLIVKEYNKDMDGAQKLICNVGMAVVKLESMSRNIEEYPLAVFSAMISCNPHYFDRGTVEGTLLCHAICFSKGSMLPESAHEWRELLLGAGLVPDNISSIVHAYGLRLRTENGWHPAYEAFFQMKEPCAITMENLKKVTAVDVVGKQVYVVENEMVFSYLLENVQDKDITLLCTSGQPRIVALELLKLISECGIDIYYSGDIDPDGIGIADRLWKRYGSHIHIWRMSPEDYDKSISNERITATGRVKLQGIEHPLLKETAACVAQRQRAGYQENILDELLGDLNLSGKK